MRHEFQQLYSLRFAFETKQASYSAQDDSKADNHLTVKLSQASASAVTNLNHLSK